MRISRITLASATALAGLLTAGPLAPAAFAAPAAPAQQGTVITCATVGADLPNAMGRDCDTGQWGPLSGFTLVQRGSQQGFNCQSGWAEGSLWVTGQQCQAVPVS